MKKWLQTLLMVIGLCIFFALLFFTTKYDSKENKAQMIAHDLQLIESILKKIHKDCEISGFTHTKNPLTFFTVGTFTGSEVGTLNLVHPDKWKGPYHKDNPSIQGFEYQVIQAKDGLFIVPGDGVKLPNGKIIGRDILLDGHSVVEDMLHKDNLLCYKEYCFAKKFDISSSIIQDLENSSEELIAG